MENTLYRSDSFIVEYANQLNCPELLACVPEYADEDHRLRTAYKMIRGVATSTDRHDYLKYNPAMRRAANKFKVKSSVKFREYIRELWAYGWLHTFQWNVKE
jgi:hypothetical protein